VNSKAVKQTAFSTQKDKATFEEEQKEIERLKQEKLQKATEEKERWEKWDFHWSEWPDD